MKQFCMVLLVSICALVSSAGTNSTRAVRSKIEPIQPTSWNATAMTSVQEEHGATWSEESFESISSAQTVEADVPVLSAVGIQSATTIDQSQITYLCVNPEVAAQMKEVSFFAAQLANGISLSPGFYTLKSVEFQGRTLHWAFAALNPKYCSSLYGIYLEMKSYEKRGLPVPQELYDKMNKAVDFYFFMEEAKARRAERRNK